jgi:cobalt-zinc-cadmium efflux system membrane fusion protein
LVALAGCPSGQPNERGSGDPPQGEVWLSEQQVKAARLTIAPAAPAMIPRRVMAAGRIGFDPQHVAHVFSPVTGRVTQILVDLGQRVEKGQPLATIDSPDVGIASADLGKALADLQAAEHEFRRQRELLAAHATSQRDYESAQDNFMKAKAEMERARQKSRLLRNATVDSVSQAYVLRAPIDGEVTARNVNPGVEVQGQYSGGTTVELFTVGELDPVWVMADVFEMDLSRVKVKNPVHVTAIAYPEQPITGQVDWVSGSLDPTTHTAKIRCTLPNKDHLLKPEMYATVFIDIGGPTQLAVPRTALLRLGDQMVVYTHTGQTPKGMLRFTRKQVVAQDEEPGDMVAVTAGLAPGEQVVTKGAVLLLGME